MATTATVKYRRPPPWSVEFDVVLQEGDSGFWIATVPSLHACHTQGKTPEEALERIREAIGLCLEREAPRPTRIEHVVV